MKRFTESEAVAIINAANGTNFKTLADANLYASATTPNERLSDMLNKITKMITGDSFFGSQLRVWENVFEYTKERLEVGALAEFVDTSLLDVKDDVIVDKTDYLPDITAIPIQYVQRYARNISKRVELVVNEAIFLRAFTNINSFNSFLTLILKRPKDSADKFNYDTICTQMYASLYNGQLLEASSMIDFVEQIYNDTAKNAPYSDQFNLGSNNGTSLMPAAQDSTNNIGTDGTTVYPVKMNTFRMEENNGIFEFPDMVLFVPGSMRTEILQALATVYHSDFQSIERKFHAIINVPQPIYDAQIAKLSAASGKNVKNIFVMVDKHAFLWLWNLEADKSQLWVKGSGHGDRQIIYSWWASMGFIPWMNGKYWYTEEFNPIGSDQATYNDEVAALTQFFDTDTNAIIAAVAAPLAAPLETALRAYSGAKTVADIAKTEVIFTNPPVAGTAATATLATYRLYVPVVSGKNAEPTLGLDSAFKYKNA